TRADLETAIAGMQDNARKSREAYEAKWGQMMGAAAAADSYQQLGNTNPKWDAAAVAALKGTGSGAGLGFESLKAAIDLGCDDPLVRYFYYLRGIQSGKLAGKPG